ncbi:hypothetical protein EI94DRAFT_1719632, partial [Lactarius quietus]
MPCIVAVFTVLRALLRKILPGRERESCCTCVCRFRASSRSCQTLLAPPIPAALPTQATSWPRRRPFPWRSSQVSVSRTGSVDVSAI